MSSYIQLHFTGISPEQSDQLIASLSNEGYDGFEEEENELKAFIVSDEFNENSAAAIAQQFNASFSKSTIGETNWNELWESNFQPVVVDDFVGIRASFHEPIRNVQHEIVITPKMSFGTGHHATTHMMIQQMREIDFNGKSVFDFGTGTGILAILAEKLGASSICAIDNDDWSISNAIENAVRNESGTVKIEKGEAIPANTSFDIILANINKHVILENLSSLAEQLCTNGILVVSGILIADEEDILVKTRSLRLRVSHRLERHNWLSVSFSRG